MGSRRRVASAGAAIAGLLLVVGLPLYRLVYLGVPLIDEWQCSSGEAPIDFPGGGKACLPAGAPLPAGASLNPLGNGPLSCGGRRGWTEVKRGVETGCLRDGRAVPEGWSK